MASIRLVCTIAIVVILTLTRGKTRVTRRQTGDERKPNFHYVLYTHMDHLTNYPAANIWKVNTHVHELNIRKPSFEKVQCITLFKHKLDPY